MNLFDLSIAGSIVCTLIFFGVAAVVWVVRRPQPALELTATSDLGPESPAVANLLANGGRVTPDAVPATLFDLAARHTVRIEEAEPGKYQCRLGDGVVGAMTPYEARVMELLRKRASGGVVPAQALTAGPSEEAKGWMKSFRREVVAEASAAGKCEPRWPRRVLGLMGLLVLGALWLGVAGGNEDDSLTIPQAIAIGLALAAGIVMAQAFTEDVQMVTPSGAVARGRWLSLRKYLHEDELFSDLPPTAVAVRDRYLAYGAALGVAAAAVRAIPMGAESDRWAWTNYGGGWRQVRVSYPERWPPAWGSSPWDIGWTGLWMTGIGGLAFWVTTQVMPGIDLGRDADSITRYVSLGVVAVTLAAAAAIALGLAVLCAAVVALVVKRSVTGEAIRIRRFGGDDGFRHYLAVYEGKGDRVRAWRIRSELYAGLSEYTKVQVTVSPLTGFVDAVQPA